MYNLQHLGWYGFQELCNSVAREILGQTAMSYLPSNDGGRDGSYFGKWQPTIDAAYEGNFVIQCKFTSKLNYNLKFSDLSEELSKAKSLVDKGICDLYIVITNAGISGRVDEKIKKEFKNAGIKHVLIFGSTWIFSQIKENSKLRRMVPRVYGLGDLSQILDERVYRQGSALLESLKDELSKVVITGAYNKAAKALQEHSFVLLIGEPAAGKTTIASLLAMGALDEWKAATLKLRTADQVVKHWNPDEPGQFYWIDDAFGATQYEAPLSSRWNHAMSEIVAMLNSGAKIVMTSRDYIYNLARKDLKVSAFPLLNESQVVIDIHKITLNEKRQMIYNHLKLGKQPKEFIKSVKPYLEFIANLERFIPETARRLADPFFTHNLRITEENLKEFVEKQESFLIEVIEGLDSDHKAALGLIYMSKDILRSPLMLDKVEMESVTKFGSTLNGCIIALEAMNGNMVQKIIDDDELIWKFKHPTIGDAFAKFVVKSSELFTIYIQGTDVDTLLEQITCGDVKLQKAIIIPKSLFPLILNRLKDYKATSRHKDDHYSSWYAQRNLLTFLSRRCSIGFLKLYVDAHPSIYEKISDPYLMSYGAVELDLANRLQQAELLPENCRLSIVAKISKCALSGENVRILEDDEMQQLFLESELDNLKNSLKMSLATLIPGLKEKWKSDYSEDEDAEYHMMSLKENLEIIETAFNEETEITSMIEKNLEDIDLWVTENTKTEPTIPKRESLDAAVSDFVPYLNQRSIFDDIDI